MENYNRLERPVQNDSAPIVVELGLTLLQIIDVVSEAADGKIAECLAISPGQQMWIFWGIIHAYCLHLIYSVATGQTQTFTELIVMLPR